MPLTELDAMMLESAIQQAFRNIGTKTEGTTQPHSGNNIEPIAWEYYVASLLNTVSNARLKAATKKALAADIIIDKEQSEHLAGELFTMWSGQIVATECKVTKGRLYIDEGLLRKALIAADIDPASANGIIEASKKEGKPPHSFTAKLIAIQD